MDASCASSTYPNPAICIFKFICLNFSTAITITATFRIYFKQKHYNKGLVVSPCLPHEYLVMGLVSEMSVLVRLRENRDTV